MGMYTEFLIKCRIRTDISEIEKKVLEYLFNGKSSELLLTPPLELPNHEFFKCDRWYHIGKSNSCYHIPYALSFFDVRYLFSRSDLKNYDDEINKFLDWINPLIDETEGRFLGWIWYEAWDKPDLIYKKHFSGLTHA
jgi:hypothetical protein